MISAENKEENIGSLWKSSINVEMEEMILISLSCCDWPPGEFLNQNRGFVFSTADIYDESMLLLFGSRLSNIYL
jgi:hypothetical protein